MQYTLSDADLSLWGWLEQTQRLLIELSRDPLDTLKRQVALAALKVAHVGAMEAEHVGERLLAQTPRFAIGQKVKAKGSLQITFHPQERSRIAT